ncbi:hypothetical protein QJS10_CPA01g00266 [Acorus calamus]|uniref:Uncharacterized protein n=1 Tax=Acorus calamus TaxID=4465 RepID=A0AAV9FLH8_ACOCL|nr:hypothetical protein QJS10_CPA01g00266 [Acorus calamus]
MDPEMSVSQFKENGIVNGGMPACDEQRNPDCLPSATGNSGTNPPLVYHRRRTEPQLNQANGSADIGNCSSLHANNENKGSCSQQQQLSENDLSRSPAVAPIPVENGRSPYMLHCMERFLQLQMNLQRFDQQQEAHEQMLRSLSGAERSRFAVELERRRIYLDVEQVQEMPRTKMVVHVLEKSEASPNDAMPAATGT